MICTPSPLRYAGRTACPSDERRGQALGTAALVGGVRTSQAVFHALAFFWLDGFAVPALVQVSPSGDDPLRGLCRKPLGG
jgi:hypothetical protein